MKEIIKLLFTLSFVCLQVCVVFASNQYSKPFKVYRPKEYREKVQDDYHISQLRTQEISPDYITFRTDYFSKRAEDTIILDDGGEFDCVGSEYVAQRFSPGVSCTLKSVILKASLGGEDCTLFVWNDSSGVPQSSSNLVPPIYFSSTVPNWQRIDLPSPIVLNSDFWIGLFPENIVLSDNTPNCEERIADSYDKIDWWVMPYHSYGELLIRPIVTLMGYRHDVSCIDLFSKTGFFLSNPATDTAGIIIKNFGNVTEYDFPVYLRVKDSLGMTVFFDVQNVDSLNHGDIDTIIIPWNHNENTDCIIEGYPWITDDCVIDNNRFELESYIRTYPGELYYDDMGVFWVGLFEDSIVNKFYPPYYPCKIESVKFAFDAWQNDTVYTFGIAAVILDDNGPGGLPGSEITKDSALGLRPGSYWWYTMDLSNHNAIIDTGAFYIEWVSLPDSTTPPFGEPVIWVDAGAPPFAKMAWFKYGGVWYWWWEHAYQWWRNADPLIRVCVDFPSAISEKSEEMNLSNYFLVNPTITKGKLKYSFFIQEDGILDVSCYGADGRSIKTLLKAHVKKGLHYIYTDLGDLPQGIYFIRMEGKGFSDSKKVILLK